MPSFSNVEKAHLDNALKDCVLIATSDMRKNASILVCSFMCFTTAMVLARGTGPLPVILVMLRVG
jgi:hypothetical protein